MKRLCTALVASSSLAGLLSAGQNEICEGTTCVPVAVNIRCDIYTDIEQDENGDDIEIVICVDGVNPGGSGQSGSH